MTKTETETERMRQRDREREGERERERKREREKERETDRERQTETDRDRRTDREQIFDMVLRLQRSCFSEEGSNEVAQNSRRIIFFKRVYDQRSLTLKFTCRN